MSNVKNIQKKDLIFPAQSQVRNADGLNGNHIKKVFSYAWVTLLTVLVSSFSFAIVLFFRDMLIEITIGGMAGLTTWQVNLIVSLILLVITIFLIILLFRAKKEEEKAKEKSQ